MDARVPSLRRARAARRGTRCAARVGARPCASMLWSATIERCEILGRLRGDRLLIRRLAFEPAVDNHSNGQP